MKLLLLLYVAAVDNYKDSWPAWKKSIYIPLVMPTYFLFAGAAWSVIFTLWAYRQLSA